MSNNIEHFTCLKWIKNKFKKMEAISVHQRNELARRIKRSPFIYAFVQLIQELSDKYQRAEERIIEEFGKKSYEYQVFKGEF
jgi:hypothetical protein